VFGPAMQAQAYHTPQGMNQLYIASLINCIQPDDGHSSIGRNM